LGGKWGLGGHFIAKTSKKKREYEVKVSPSGRRRVQRQSQKLEGHGNCRRGPLSSMNREYRIRNAIVSALRRSFVKNGEDLDKGEPGRGKRKVQRKE